MSESNPNNPPYSLSNSQTPTIYRRIMAGPRNLETQATTVQQHSTIIPPRSYPRSVSNTTNYSVRSMALTGSNITRARLYTESQLHRSPSRNQNAPADNQVRSSSQQPMQAVQTSEDPFADHLANPLLNPTNDILTPTPISTFITNTPVAHSRISHATQIPPTVNSVRNGNLLNLNFSHTSHTSKPTQSITPPSNHTTPPNQPTPLNTPPQNLSTNALQMPIHTNPEHIRSSNSRQISSSISQNSQPTQYQNLYIPS